MLNPVGRRYAVIQINLELRPLLDSRPPKHRFAMDPMDKKVIETVKVSFATVIVVGVVAAAVLLLLPSCMSIAEEVSLFLFSPQVLRSRTTRPVLSGKIMNEMKKTRPKI